MAELVPLKAVYDGSSICGLSELRDGDVVGVEHGGLGVCTIPSNTLLIGNGQGAISTTSALTTNGQIIIGGTGGPQIANLTGTSNEVEITDGNGAITIGLPATVQIATNLKTPAFSITNEYCLPTSDGSAGQIMCTNGSGALAFVDFDGTGHCIAFSGTTVADRTCLNFLGGGVTVSDNSGTNATDITIPVTTPELKVRNTSGSELSIQLDNAAIGGELICDTTPQLGGTLDVNGYAISSVSNCNISISPNGTGSVILDGLSWPQADGTAGYILCTNGSGSLSWAADAAGGSAAGSNNELQYNSSGSFGASSNLTFDGSALTVSGSVGIGTAAPDGPLHVMSASAGTVTADANADELVIEGSGNVGLTILSANTSQGNIAFGDDGNAKQGIFGFHQGNAEFNWSQATQQMVLNSSGYLGIGNAAPSTYANGNAALVIGVGGASGSAVSEITIASDDGGVGELNFTDTANTTNQGYIKYDHSDNGLQLNTADHIAYEIGGNEVGRMLASGTVMISETSNSFMSLGVTIEQADNDNEILAFKSSDVAHGITDITETDTWGLFKKNNATDGGMKIESESGGGIAMHLFTVGSEGSTTKSTSAWGTILLTSTKKSGTSNAILGSDENMVVMSNGNQTRFIFDADGDGHADSSWTTYSDSRLKKNVIDCPYGLAEVLQLQPKKFDRHSGKIEDGEVVLEDNARSMIGFLAQDVKALMPELVKDVDTTESFYSMDDGKLAAVLVNAIQELNAKLEGN